MNNVVPFDRDAQFSVYIKQVIKERHLKKSELAEMMGMQQPQFSRKLNCWERFSIEQAFRICEILDIEFVIGRKRGDG